MKMFIIAVVRYIESSLFVRDQTRGVVQRELRGLTGA